MSVPAIEVVNLEKVYMRRRADPVRAVDGLSFSIAPGSIFGLLGPNGAGKTTTLKILTTLIKPTSGQARILGIDAVREPLKVRQRIAVVIQESAVELFLSVRDNLHTFARFHGLRGEEIDRRAGRVMAQFGLESESGKKVMDLSGGFRRRVQVAKVFMVDTPVRVSRRVLDRNGSDSEAIGDGGAARERASGTDDRPDDADPAGGGRAVRRHSDRQSGQGGGARRSAHAEAAGRPASTRSPSPSTACPKASRRSWRRGIRCG